MPHHRPPLGSDLGPDLEPQLGLHRGADLGPVPVAEIGVGVTAVAHRLGVAPATLRTWDRRYGIGPTGHRAGSRRRYTSADVGRLTLMRRLMVEGLSAADAARAATATEAEPRDLGSAHRAAGRPGGGQVLPVPDAAPAARGLARAAMALDSATCAAMLANSLDTRGVVATWHELVLPVLGGVGDRWRATGQGIEVEHLLTESVEDALRATTRRLTAPGPTAPVIVAAPQREAHHLPLQAVAAALAERSIAVRSFGAGMPMVALARAVSRTGAAVVFLWARGSAGRLDRGGLAALSRARPRPMLVLGGPGWADDDLDHAVRRVDGLAATVAAVLDGLAVPGREGRA